MNLVFSKLAWKDYLYWQKKDKDKIKRIQQLIQDIQKSPYSGIGKPEPLKHALSGYWSRRIDHEHRLVYKVVKGQILIAQLRYHY
ncbi:MAG: toxin YoeB [Deltaproteobacteria bacterium RIFCSPLOWO2_12_FULL_40_28]|nr:MAG: toxin YoeB [Deltaproteobacteria bacterium RIFCSPHIGHO2_02_FULL_40_28]OGQ18841.1 MAG: toxin YoeB [Deltaproteobacteria bacterium RIFCSPHIGHO2_12_FULL_40_32]OGQ40086.1 MAG: toxin YoeB [Deltaproteobacteria bacterium RIFCSPLOWO2_02_FULL_40_36]OGQ53269.1 MAG: toxin YoeB [Deltaproteobacteria bacterium RIFCSPLOWO2_12_FULL_40_28]